MKWTDLTADQQQGLIDVDAGYGTATPGLFAELRALGLVWRYEGKHGAQFEKLSYLAEKLVTDRLTTALEKNSDTDYTLKANSVWITVNNVSIYIRRDEHEVVVRMYKRGFEEGEEVAPYGLAANFKTVEGMQR